MSITLERPATDNSAARDEVQWIESHDVLPPVWVGRYRDVYLGMIEHRDPEGYTAITHRGRGLGNFATLEEAQRAFYR